MHNAMASFISDILKKCSLKALDLTITNGSGWICDALYYQTQPNDHPPHTANCVVIVGTFNLYLGFILSGD
jgi:hypothetical protein